MCAKKKRHEVVLVIVTDKPCTQDQAIAAARDCLHGEFYPADWRAGDIEHFKIVKAKRPKG